MVAPVPPTRYPLTLVTVQAKGARQMMVLRTSGSRTVAPLLNSMAWNAKVVAPVSRMKRPDVPPE